MKKIITYLSLIILILTGCQKYEFDVPTIENTEWVLVNGRVYIENLGTGELTYYEHFDNTQTISNLDIYGGSQIDIDVIEKNVTTWYFENGTFTLNNSNTYQYTKHGSGSRSQYKLLGVPPYGSSRSLGILDFNDEFLHVKIHESNESNNGENYHYYTVLTFVKAGGVCDSCAYESNLPYENGGTLDLTAGSVPGHQQLIGTSWIITRYDNGMTPVYPNDTINFVSGVSYDINGSNPNTYSLSNNTGNNLYNLTIYECVSLGGNYSGQVNLSFIDEGELNNLTMNGIFGTSGYISLWMERIN